MDERIQKEQARSYSTDNLEYRLRLEPKQEGMSDFGVGVVCFVSFILGVLSWVFLLN